MSLTLSREILRASCQRSFTTSSSSRSSYARFGIRSPLDGTTASRRLTQSQGFRSHFVVSAGSRYGRRAWRAPGNFAPFSALAFASVVIGSSYACLADRNLSDISLCEPDMKRKAIDKSRTIGDEKEQKEDEEEDPYATLPEDDEPTDCSMCNSFRKGPCRPYWRKLERCLKDNQDSDEGVGVRCKRYFLAHHECILQFTNLYQLVSLEMKQELVNDADLSILEHERRRWDPKIDWTIWMQFTSEVGVNYKETTRSRDKGSGELLPLWKRLPEGTEPVLLTIPTHLPQVDEESGLILKIAYAVDQDGFALGMDYNKRYGALVEKSLGEASTEEKTDSSGEAEETNENPEDDPMYKFEFIILPGETKTVQICGLYSQNPLEAEEDKQVLDALLFKSSRHRLKNFASRNSKKHNK